MGGELWEVHGGGFYHVQKYRVAPRTLPDRLAWFKWEAYTTWLSGFALLCIVYFSDARAYLIDRSVADLTVPEAIAISVGFVVAGWLVYDLLCRILGRWPRVLALDALRLHRALGVRRRPALRTARDVHHRRLDDRDDDGRQRPLRHHPRSLGADPREAGGARARSRARDQGQAALGPQQLPDAARAADDAQQPLPVRLRPRGRVARAVRVRRAGRVRAALLQPAPPRPQRVVDPRRLGARRARARDLAAAARRGRRAARHRRRPCRRQAALRDASAARVATSCATPTPPASSAPTSTPRSPRARS